MIGSATHLLTKLIDMRRFAIFGHFEALCLTFGDGQFTRFFSFAEALVIFGARLIFRFI